MAKRVVLIGLEGERFCTWLGFGSDSRDSSSYYPIKIGNLPVQLWTPASMFDATTYAIVNADGPDCILLVYSHEIPESFEFARHAESKLTNNNHVIIFVCVDTGSDKDIFIDFDSKSDKQKLADYICERIEDAYTDYDDSIELYEDEDGETLLTYAELNRIHRIKRDKCCTIL